MATVRYDGNEVTFSGESIYEVLEQVGDWLADIDSYNEMLAQEAAAIYEAEYYAEVIGPMKAAEDAAERAGWGDEDPVW